MYKTIDTIDKSPEPEQHPKNEAWKFDSKFSFIPNKVIGASIDVIMYLPRDHDYSSC